MTAIAIDDSGDNTLQSAIAQGPFALELVRMLSKLLAADGINYCHWKSNQALDRSASGDNDLDLLISRADAQRFTAVLLRLGFKEALTQPEKQLPGVLHYYGYDSSADKFVHVHAHYQLILGDDTTKNYRLPIEEAYLASAVQGDLFRVPAPEFEFIVFVIRMMLKYASGLAILMKRGLSVTEQRELVWLTDQVDQVRMRETLHQHLPFMSETVLDQCIQLLQSSHQSNWYRYQIGRQLHRELGAHARRGNISDLCLKLWRRVIWGMRRHVLRKSVRNRVRNGGAIIALVGGDGSGKSTAVEELHSWLSKNFLVMKVHFGKPPRSSSAFLLKGLMKVWNWLVLRVQMISRSTPTKTECSRSPHYSRLLLHVLTARDRHRLYRKVRRFAAKGGLIVCDRYPLPEIKLMDGAQITRLINAEHSSRVTRLLIKVEEAYYQPMTPPDILAVLRVAPEIAAQRRADEHKSYVRIRCQEIWDLYEETAAHVIDAGLSRADVSSHLKALVWSKL